MSRTITTLPDVAAVLAANLRAAADLVDAHPDIKQPYITTLSNGGVDLSWYLNGKENARKTAAAVVRAIDGTWERGEADYSGPLATWTQRRGGLNLLVQVSREEVCERIVVSTKTVTIPARPAQPEQVVEQDVVEWRCQPLLADKAVAS